MTEKICVWETFGSDCIYLLLSFVGNVVPFSSLHLACCWKRFSQDWCKECVCLSDEDGGCALYSVIKRESEHNSIFFHPPQWIFCTPLPNCSETFRIHVCIFCDSKSQNQNFLNRKFQDGIFWEKKNPRMPFYYSIQLPFKQSKERWRFSSAMLLEVTELYYFRALKSQCLWSFLELSFFSLEFSVHRKFVHEFCFCFTEFTFTSRR